MPGRQHWDANHPLCCDCLWPLLITPHRRPLSVPRSGGNHARHRHHRPEPRHRQLILDPAGHAEFARLSSLTRLYDPTTLRLCQQLGLTTGWRCLDVGAWTGSVARQLAAQAVAPTGSVLALDIDTRFLDPLADDTLKVERADVTRDPLPVGEFDLVHARLLLEHLPQRDRVVASLAAALRPGGCF